MIGQMHRNDFEDGMKLVMSRWIRFAYQRYQREKKEDIEDVLNSFGHYLTEFGIKEENGA